MTSDETWMHRALELAERGRGWVEPNPLVGAVVVRDEVVGEGWHERFGQAHAEVNALAHAGERAQGATLFVTLEPCCHHGKTPPCTDAVLRAGIRRVVAAMLDPFPKVAGGGTAQLRAAGLEVEVGLCEMEARRLNAPYLTLLTHGRPHVHAKWAMTLDGKIATATGDSKWISNSASRQRVHQLRGRMDGILVGIGTALADDPLLTARPPGPRNPTRVILDSQARLPLTSQLVQTAHEVPVLVATTQNSEQTRLLESAGVEVLSLPGTDKRVHVQQLLSELGQRRWTNLLVEGGGETLGSFRDLGLIDEVHMFIAPLLLEEAAGAVAHAGGRGGDHRRGGAAGGVHWEVETIESDFYLHGWRE